MTKIVLKLEELVDSTALRHELTSLTSASSGDGSATAVRSLVLSALKSRIAGGKRLRRTPAEGRRQRHGLRAPPVASDGRDHPRPLRFCRDPRLPRQEPVGGRAHVDRGGRRLRARHAGAGLRHRPALPPALQADALGRAGGRIHALHALGYGAEGRPLHPQHRRLPAAFTLRHDDPHGNSRGALRLGRKGALRRVARPLRPRGH